MTTVSTDPHSILSGLPGTEEQQLVTVAGQSLTVFAESPPLFTAMHADIAAARQRIWVETYIFFNDEGGKRFAEALKRKAAEGLDVRVLYDAVGSAFTPAAFFADMQKGGVKVHAYHSVLEGLRRFRLFRVLNRRNHRKLMVIDDAVGYFGGMNLIDNVDGADAKKAGPSSGGWRDIHLRLEGSQQHELAESFERSWTRARGERPARRPRGLSQSRLRQATEDHHEVIRFFDSDPRDSYSRAARIYARLIRRARHQITLSMAYFLPTGAVLRALLSRRRHHVGVRVIVPGKSDVAIVQRATAFLYSKLLRRGFRIYERQHRMLHAKVMVIDTLYTVAGSANLDPRSFFSNLEFLAVIRSETLARIMLRICRYEVRQSVRITRARARRTPWIQQLMNRMAWWLRWWL